MEYDADNIWIVSDEHCKGCQYYGYLSNSGHGGVRCCDYTFLTDKVRKQPPYRCEVKVIGRKLRHQ